jgi:hypothetical protein
MSKPWHFYVGTLIWTESHEKESPDRYFIKAVLPVIQLFFHKCIYALKQ